MAVQLKDKVAIVTGSSSGIGEAVAITFASRGAKVTLCGRDQERLKLSFDKTVKASGGHQDRVHSVQGDLNDQNVQKAIVSQTVEKFGRLDILVANAGVLLANDTISTIDEGAYDTIMNTNLKSVFFLTQKAIPHLETSKGNIITICSVVSTMALKFATVYSMSKVAVDHLTRCLAVDLGSKGIRVNGIYPGYVPSQVLREFSDSQSRKIQQTEHERTALKERDLTAEDIAEAVCFLVSPAASFITGEMIKVDGGRSYGGPGDLENIFLEM